MTDLEITKLCAEALGWVHLGAIGTTYERSDGLYCLSGGNDWWRDPDGNSICGRCEQIPDPLHDDAQAMALVKKLRLQIDPHDEQWNVGGGEGSGGAALCESLNRAICECVAKMQAAK